ncbi:hypothetical protein L249_5970 [Ophiocordyceps polyrhachis-furcata BCC 54312]|uniref:Uncharacterized protein n=1 Tax=Ophiocordyceps polyrhachis-furcata BCC 54312 TaxID=1330021 RepID=A0A367LJ55_9HYPO|nr:hypothetical protein L249_5970 [Ophiocordyceps polyrhachis-furcata BCC 54312]
MFRKKSKVREGVDVGAALRCARPRRPTIGRERLRRPPLACSECPIRGSIGGISVLPREPRVCGSSPILVLAGHFAIPGL